MDAGAVFRVISLIPDRMPRSLSGTAFDGATCERTGLLSRFLGWLGPLSPISSEEQQQLLGARAAPVVRLLLEDEGEAAEDAEDAPVRAPGTRIPA